jgi:hypothetical protein
VDREPALLGELPVDDHTTVPEPNQVRRVEIAASEDGRGLEDAEGFGKPQRQVGAVSVGPVRPTIGRVQDCVLGEEPERLEQLRLPADTRPLSRVRMGFVTTAVDSGGTLGEGGPNAWMFSWCRREHRSVSSRD